MEITTCINSAEQSAPVRKSLTLDLSFYEDQLDDPELDEQSREDILIALWTIICCFVDLGYQMEPEQSCGQIENSAAAQKIPPGDPVDLKDQQSTRKTLAEEFRQAGR